MSASSQPSTTIDVLARSGQPSPDGNGVFSVFAGAVQNDAGILAANASFAGTTGGFEDDDALILYLSEGLMLAHRESDDAPDGNGQLAGFGIPSPIGKNTFAVVSLLRNTANASQDNSAILTFSGLGASDILAREGAPMPDGNGDLSSIDPVALSGATPAIFTGQVRNTVGGSSDNEVLLSAMANPSLSIVAREGQTIPIGNGTFRAFQSYSANAAGDIAFAAELDGTPANQAVYVKQKGVLIQVAREDEAAPDGDGVFNRFGNPQVNDHGSIAFVADLSTTALGSEDDHAIYLAALGADLAEISRENTPAPSGNGTIATYEFEDLSLNNADQIVVPVFYRDTAASSLDNSGLLFIESGTTRSIAREGDPVPSNDGEFSSFGRPALSEAGHIAFGASLRNTSAGGSVSGLFFCNPSGQITEVLRTGASFDGGTVLSLDFVSDELHGSGLGNDGSIVFSYVLTDLRSGLCIARIRCLADTNNDGQLTSADFSAWIAAFNSGSPACDQNGDGSCTPADFTAWIANFNAGC